MRYKFKTEARRSQIDTCTRAAVLACWLVFAMVGLCGAQGLDVGVGDQPLPAPPDEEVAPIIQDHPVVVSIRESNPKTPADLTTAVDMLLQLGETKEARRYANQLALAKLDENALADLGEKLGSLAFLRIVNNEALGAKPRKFARSVLDAVRARKTDPARLTALAEQAKQPGGAERQHAIADLRSAGPMSVQPLVRILADPAQADSHVYARDALVRLGRQAVPPLLAVLQTEDEPLRTQVLLTLARLKDPRSLYDVLCHSRSTSAGGPQRRAAQLAAANLLGEVPSTEQVKRKVYTAIHDYLTGRRHLPTDVDGNIDDWRWDDQKQEISVHRVPEQQAIAALADRLADQLYQVDPSDRRLLRMTAIARLQHAKLSGGLDKPLDQKVAAEITGMDSKAPVDFVEQVLSLAMSRRHMPAAAAAAELLGSAGESGAELLIRHGSSRSPLVRALASPDRRLRFAATRAIAGLKPESHFSGSSGVSEALRYFAKARGRARVLVADPRPKRGELIAGLAAENGLEPDLVYTGRSMLQAATQSPEYVAALMAFTIDRPDIRETLSQLREHPWTANLPVGLVIELRHRLEAEAVVRDDPLTQVFVVPRDATTMKLRLNELVAAAANSFVPHQQRMRQAAAAMQMLAVLSQQRTGPFELDEIEPVLEPALHDPRLAAQAAQALGNLGSPAAQRALVDAASMPSIPIAARRAAADAFVASAQKHGLALTVSQVRRQAQRYDQQADIDPATEEVLWSILDALQSAKR